MKNDEYCAVAGRPARSGDRRGLARSGGWHDAAQAADTTQRPVDSDHARHRRRPRFLRRRRRRRGAGRRHDPRRGQGATVSPTQFQDGQDGRRISSAGSSATSSAATARPRRRAMQRAPKQRGARLRRHRHHRRLHPDQQPRRRRRRRASRSSSPTAGRFTAKVVGTDKPSDLALLKVDADRPAPDRARQLGQRAGRRRRARGRQPARRRPDRDDGDHQREGAVDRASATAATRTSCRPTRRSTTATPAARSSTPRASWSASTRRSCRATTATSASASRFRRTWRRTSWSSCARTAR